MANTVGGGTIAAQVIVNTKQAEQSLRLIQDLSKVAEKSLRQLSTEGMGALSKTTIDATGALQKHEAALGSNEKALRGFFSEQRLQSRVMRESSQAVLGLVTAFAFLQASNDNQSASQKRLQTGLFTFIAAMNATEFSVFSLSRAGAALPGVFGSALAGLGPYGAAIGAVIGIGAGLIAFFKESTSSIDSFTLSMEASVKQLKELQKELVLDIANVSDKSFAEIGELITDQQKGLDDLRSSLRGINDELRAGGSEDRIKGLQAEKKLLEERIDVLEKYKDALIEEGHLRILARDTTFQSIEAAKSLFALEKIITALVHARNIATEKEIGHWKTLLELANARKKALEESPAEAAKREEDLETKRRDIRSKYTDQNLKDVQAANTKLLDLEDEMRSKSAVNEFQKRRDEEDLHYRQRLGNIEDLVNKTESGDAAIADKKRLNREAEVEHVSNIAIIKKDEQDKITRATEDASRREIEGLDRMITAAGDLASLLSKGGDDFIGKMLQALQLALQIERAIAVANSPTGGGFDISNILSIGTKALGIFGLFDQGGYTGQGQRSEPAGVVHKGEYVFEKPLVDSYGKQIQMMHSIMRKGYAGGGMVSASGGFSSGAPPQVVVVLQGTLEGQRFLRKEYPTFEKFLAKRNA